MKKRKKRTRATKPEPDAMDRARAARAMIETQPPGQHREKMELAAFLAIFHPELSKAEIAQMVRGAQP